MIIGNTTRAVTLALIFALLGLGSCQSDETTATPDTEVVSAEDAWSRPAQDTVSSGGWADIERSAPDVVERPDPGELGAPCSENAECYSGLCIAHPEGGYVCTKLCDVDCPPGWLCKGTAPWRPDVMFVCTPEVSVLCAPCVNDTDCGGTEHHCMSIGTAEDHQFCGRGCDDDADCPETYVCEDGTTWDGRPSRQCVPETGSCICTQELNQTLRACSNENAWGTCYGDEVCDGSAGWSGCTAAEPTEEVCDGVDNDCDGDADEGHAPSPCIAQNEFGVCNGVRSCQGAAGLVCDAPEPEAESCDGIDNDCNGYIDELFPDSDGDGLANCVDSDDDNDELVDEADNCPTVPNASQADQDGDGLGDLCDDDDDGDGVADALDSCPTVANPNPVDTDGDGVDDACDPDDDNDGSPDSLDCEPLIAAISPLAIELCNGIDDNCNDNVDEAFADSDGDDIADCVDGDDDGDLSDDVDDCAPLNALIGPTVEELCDAIDNDCDGATDETFPDADNNGILDCVTGDVDEDGDPDGTDCAPYDGNVGASVEDICNGIDDNCDGITDPGEPDTDDDGLADCIDIDDDNDGSDDDSDCQPIDPSKSPLALEVCNGVDDNCNEVIDEGFADLDDDGQADCVDPDDDGDGVNDAIDLCPYLADPDQQDTDGDGAGDVCDDDSDADGVPNTQDNCPLDANAGQSDWDGDGQGDACDLDDDNDGVADIDDCGPFDPDTKPGSPEVCDGLDNNCDGDTDSEFDDFDGDGFSDCVDPDDDADGDPDFSDCEPFNGEVHASAAELCDGIDNNCKLGVDEGYSDLDDDGIADCVDPDSDGDGVINEEDNCPYESNVEQNDLDQDGYGDACDPVVPGPLHQIVLRDGPMGLGEVIDNRTVIPGEEGLTVYAAGYDAQGLYLGDQSALWNATGSLEDIPVGPSTFVVFSPTIPKTSGAIHALPEDNLNVFAGVTGTITVGIPPVGPPDPNRSSISADRPVLVLGGDSAIVVVRLVDEWGTPVTEPHDVVINATLGELQGSATSLGNGTYEQLLAPGALEGTTTLTATVDGEPIDSETTIDIIELAPLYDDFVINCTNYPTYQGKNLLISKVTVSIASEGCSPMVFGHVIVEEAGKLRTSQPDSQGQPNRLDMIVDSLTVSENSSVDVSCQGYEGGVWFEGVEWDSSYGNTSGGSHGGRGSVGVSNDGLSIETAATYGDLRSPRTAGAGGSYGDGGGLIRIVTSTDGSIILHGQIKANGCSHQSGSGAGGGIFIQTPSFGGSGRIEARGGDGLSSVCGGSCYTNSGGGGGGRVAIVGYNSLSGNFAGEEVVENIDVSGGDAVSGAAGAGTLFLQSAFAAHGDLIVSNQGKQSRTWGTTLMSVGAGVVYASSAEELIDPDQSWLANLYKDHIVNPDVAQGNPESMVDDIFATLVGNTATSLFATSNLEIGEPGATYRSVHLFDNLEIRDGASVSADGGELLVYHGDLFSGDDDRFVLRGDLDAVRLDLADTQSIEIRDGAHLQVETLVGGQSASFAFDYVLDAGALTMPNVTATDFVASASTVNIGTLSASGDVHLLDGSIMTIDGNVLSTESQLSLSGSSTLRSSNSTVSQTRQLQISAALVQVEEGSVISADGAGYPPGVGHDDLNESVGDLYAGGSHAGLGTETQSDSKAASVYGSLYEPTLPGLGADGGGAGGGVIRLNVVGTTAVDGAIRANGASAPGGGGAGGSIFINTKALTGDGTIEASGGTGGEVTCGESCSALGGGGGGGRIALQGFSTLLDGFSDVTTGLNLQAFGGVGGDGAAAGAGTVFIKEVGATHGDLVIHNGHAEAGERSTPMVTLPAAVILDVTDNIIEVPGPLAPDFFAGSLIALGDAEPSGGLSGETTLTVVANDATFLTLDGTEEALAELTSGLAYRTLFVFDNLEVRGGAHLSVDGDLLLLEGDIAQEDQTSLRLQGRLTASRLDVNQVDDLGIVGGGLDVQALLGGDGAGSAPSVTLEQSSLVMDALVAEDLVASSSTMLVDSIMTSGDIQLDATTLEVREGSVKTDGSFTVTGESTLTHPPATMSTFTKLHIEAEHFLLDEGAAIDVDGKGLPAQSESAPPGSDGVTSGRAGGSHGGLGGAGATDDQLSQTYGSLVAPTLPGAGSAQGGSGGGAVRIEVSQTVTIGGAVSARGSSHPDGGGAGGSVWVQSPTLLGEGTIDASGGDGSPANCGEDCAVDSGAGGGGRIALSSISSLGGAFSDSQSFDGFRAYGGRGGLPGGAGTIAIERTDSVYPDLIVDNGGVNAPPQSTALVAMPEGQVLSVSDASITISQALIPGRYEGYSLNVNVDPAAESINLDSVVTITENNIIDVSFDTSDNLSTMTSAGATYRSVFIFENLSVKGGAYVGTEADIIVISGDVDSKDETSFVLDGRLDAARLDLGGATSLSLQPNAHLGVDAVVGQSSANQTLSYSITDATVTQPVMSVGSLLANNASITVGQLLGSGDVVLQDSTLTVTDGLIDLGSNGMLNLSGDTVLTHPPGEPEQPHSLLIRALNLIIGPASRVDLDGKGYPLDSGPDGLMTAQGWMGASHGGRGGLGIGYDATDIDSLGIDDGRLDYGFDSETATLYHPGATYGHLWNPTLPGASAGSRGGGALTVELTGVLVLDGVISANGSDAPVDSATAGGGAGGSILIKAVTVSGTGTVSANGGSGALTEVDGSFESKGGGGGGRIALVGYALLTGEFSDGALSERISATGGESSVLPGGAGTIYAKSLLETEGTLSLRSHASSAHYRGQVELQAIPQGQVLNVQGDELFNFGAFSDAQWAGFSLTPNTDQGSDGSFSDHVLFTVVSHNDNALELSPRGADQTATLDDVTAVGKFYRGITVLDKLIVEGAGVILSDGDLLITGQGGTNGGLTLDAAAQLGVARLDVTEATTLSGLPITASELWCVGCGP